MPNLCPQSISTIEHSAPQVVLLFLDTLNERGATLAALRDFTSDTVVMASLLTLDAAVPNFYLHVTAVQLSGDFVNIHAKVLGLGVRGPAPTRVDLPVVAKLLVHEGRIVQLAWQLDADELRRQTGVSGLEGFGSAARERPPHHAGITLKGAGFQ